MSVYACANVGVWECVFVPSPLMCVCVQLRVYICACVCTVCGCAHMCSAVRAGYKSGVGDHAGVRATGTSGAPAFLVGSFRC